VGVLALVQPSEAKIVYTKAHHVIGPNSSFQLDLNHDGHIDFTVTNRNTSGDLNAYYLSRHGAQGNGAECIRGNWGFSEALALKRGVRVGSGRRFCQTDRLEEVVGLPGSFTYVGYWKNVADRYLGLKFKIKGQTHYGWARLNVSFKNGLRAVLTGYAYETVPNKPIVAGQTRGPDDLDSAERSGLHNTAPRSATLGALAAGCPFSCF
jgi:hypothetical protein